MQNFDINDSQPNSGERKNSEFPKKNLHEIEEKEKKRKKRSPTIYKRQLAIGGRRSGGEREYRRLMQNALSPRK